MYDSTSDEEEPMRFDVNVAQELVGKYVLVGMTIYDKRGEFKRQQQFHGVVVSTDETLGIYLALRGASAGEDKWLPPCTNTFVAAPPGIYRLRASGEEVIDPDYTATWKVTQPDA